jgi:hypothetical protein
MLAFPAGCEATGRFGDAAPASHHANTIKPRILIDGFMICRHCGMENDAAGNRNNGTAIPGVVQ